MTERFPFGPSTRPEPPFFPRKQRLSPDRPAAVQGAKRRKRTLDGEDRSGIIQGEGKGGIGLLASESLVEQPENGSGQQNDERPNHTPDHSSQVLNAGTLRIDPGSEFGDLGSENGNDILPSQAAVFLGGFVGQVGFPRPRYARLERALRSVPW